MVSIGKAGEILDGLTGVNGSLGYLFIVAMMSIGYILTMSGSGTKTVEQEEEEEVPDPPRNFTAEQLKFFDGSLPEGDETPRPVYMSVAGTVFDVSEGRDFYGPGGPYETFAGRECGVALAKMAFDEKYLDDVEGVDKLSGGEKMELEGWIDKFTYYRPYPIKGKLVPASRMPDPNRKLTKEDLAKCNGKGEPPDGYGATPIYIAVNGKIFDMSFGGVTFYGNNGPYEKLAGRDASRSLAKMSLDDENLENTSILDLTPKQLKVMNDWSETFEKKKRYPIVGRAAWSNTG